MASIVGVMKVFDGTEDVGGTNTVTKGLSTTAMIPLNAGGTFSVFIDAASSGTIALTVECVVYYKDTIASAVEPDGMSDIATIADGSVHCASFAPPVVPYMAIKVTGTGANDATTKATIWLCQWETL